MRPVQTQVAGSATMRGRLLKEKQSAPGVNEISGILPTRQSIRGLSSRQRTRRRRPAIAAAFFSFSVRRNVV
jgi:hypothetical protein